MTNKAHCGAGRVIKIARRIVGVPILWIGAFFLIFGAVIAYGLWDTKKTVDDFRRRMREDG